MIQDIEFHNMLNNINNINAVDFLNNYNQVPRRSYTIRARIDPFEELDENEFFERFRFTKDETHEIYALIDGARTLEPLVNGKIDLIIKKD